MRHAQWNDMIDEGGLFMRISVLTDMISEEIPCVVSGYIEDVELKRFMFLTETASTYDDVCLYIGDAERLKGASYRMTLLTMAETDEETEKNHTVIRVPQEYYAECLNVVTKAFFHEQELEDAFNRLLSRPVEQRLFMRSSIMPRSLWIDLWC